MHGFNAISTVLCALMTLLDLNHANSITKHNQESLQDNSFLDLSIRYKPLCTTDADCPAASGKTCVTGVCFCNRFGWIHQPDHQFTANHCYQYICTLHEDCRANFGQGSYCNTTSSGSSHHYCVCATEIDHVTQICANPTTQIYNSTCTHNSTCAQRFGPQAHCQYRTCVCEDKFRFSQLAQKCVPLDENVNVEDFTFLSSLKLMAALVSLLIMAACVGCYSDAMAGEDSCPNPNLSALGLLYR